MRVGACMGEFGLGSGDLGGAPVRADVVADERVGRRDRVGRSTQFRGFAVCDATAWDWYA